MQGIIPDHQELFEVINIFDGEDEVTHIPIWEIIAHYKDLLLGYLRVNSCIVLKNLDDFLISQFMKPPIKGENRTMMGLC